MFAVKILAHLGADQPIVALPFEEPSQAFFTGAIGRCCVDEVYAKRPGFSQELDRFRMVPHSRSNFFLIEILDPEIDSTQVFDGLLERGVIVKDGSVSFRGLEKRFMRSDANLEPRMNRLVDALADLP